MFFSSLVSRSYTWALAYLDFLAIHIIARKFSRIILWRHATHACTHRNVHSLKWQNFVRTNDLSRFYVHIFTCTMPLWAWVHLFACICVNYPGFLIVCAMWSGVPNCIYTRAHIHKHTCPRIVVICCWTYSDCPGHALIVISERTYVPHQSVRQHHMRSSFQSIHAPYINAACMSLFLLANKPTYDDVFTYVCMHACMHEGKHKHTHMHAYICKLTLLHSFRRVCMSNFSSPWFE